ncbi:MAG: DUF4339 domain-containing protein [Bdellovibrionota bacterium]
MDGIEEKKWFLYMADHHEGPFSLEEIKGKLSEGRASTLSYVWKEGMPDWQVMSDLTDFEEIIASVTPPEPVLIEPDAAPLLVSKQKDKKDIEFCMPNELLENLEGSQGRSAEKSGIIRRLLPVVGIVLVLGIAAMVYFSGLGHGLGEKQGFILKVIDVFPLAGKWISPIPAINDVSQEEYNALREAARLKIDQASPRIGMALSMASPEKPFFYLSANLPDGAIFDVSINGVEGTMAGQVAFSWKGKIILAGRLGKSEVIALNDGRPIPRGEYSLSIKEADNQLPAVSTVLETLKPEASSVIDTNIATGDAAGKIFIEKTYFLGGAKDAEYAAKLKEFHESMRAKAAHEFEEIKQFLATIESQQNESTVAFNDLRRKGNKATFVTKGAWLKYHDKWEGLENKLREAFQRWTQDVLEKEYFYGVLYLMLRQVGEALDKLHDVQHSFFTKPVEPQAFEIQLGEASSLMQSTVMALKTKIEQAEKIPPTTTGMPRKEGL